MKSDPFDCIKGDICCQSGRRDYNMDTEETTRSWIACISRARGPSTAGGPLGI